MKRLTALTVALCIAALALPGFSEDMTSITSVDFQGLPFREFLDTSYHAWLLRDPERVTILGLASQLGTRNDRLTDVSSAFAQESEALLQEILTELRLFDRSSLTEQDALSYDFYEWLLQDELGKLRYRLNDYLITSFTVYSVDWLLMDLFGSTHPLLDQADLEDYLSRLSQVEWKLHQVIDELLLRKEAGIVPPRFMLTRSIEQIQTWLGIFFMVPAEASAISPYGTEIYQTTRNRFKSCAWLSSEELKSYTDLAIEAIQSSYIPGFFDLLGTLESLVEIAPEIGGATSMPNGSEYLAFSIEHHMTLQMTPDEIYQMGLDEVARIQEEMRDIFESMGYDRTADLSALWDRAYREASVPAAGDLEAEFAAIQAEIEAAMGPVFNLKPSIPLELHPAPAGMGYNYYTEPALDGSRPGIFFYQSSPNPYAAYSRPGIFHHEAIPGHHYQLALMKELDLPLFRQIELPTSHGEGWAVYAEGLAAELGVYEGNPLGNLERLGLEIMRAARLVLEMGIHHLGWSHYEGATYFAEILRASPSSMVNLMPRYVGYPGQGSSYTVGLLKIRELRTRMEQELGEAFELATFHDLLLKDGPMPLEILEDLVDRTIARALGAED